MRGSIRQRSPGRWELRVYVGRHPISGNPRQISRAFVGTKKKAEEELRALIRDVEKEHIVAKPVLDPAYTVTALFERFLQRHPLAPSTKETYRSFFHRHIDPHLGHYNVAAVSTADLNDFYDYLTEVVGLRPGSVRHGHAVISSAFAFGISENFGGLKRGDNPATGATLPSDDSEQIIPPSPAQVATILDPAVHFDPGFLLACRLAVATGARRGEICGLRWFDLGPNRTLHVARSVFDPGHGQPMIVKTPKSKKDRRFALDVETWTMLSEIALDPTLGPRDYMTSGGPEPTSPDTVTQQWMQLCQRLRIEGVRFHDLRHFHATQLLRSGKVSPSEVSRRLGHSKTSITLDVYAHAMPVDDHHAAAVISDVMGFRQLDAPSEPERIVPLNPPA